MEIHVPILFRQTGMGNQCKLKSDCLGSSLFAVPSVILEALLYGIAAYFQF